MEKQTCKLSTKNGTALALRGKKYAFIKLIKDNILDKEIKKATQCKKCGKILPFNNIPIVCDDCRKQEYLNLKTLDFYIDFLKKASSLPIEELDYKEMFGKKESIRGYTSGKPVIKYVFESVKGLKRREKTEDHINGITSVIKKTIELIKLGELKTNKQIKEFIWEKSATLEVSVYDNVNGLKKLQNKETNITPEEYISVVGRIQKPDGSFYSKDESAEMIRPYFI